MTDNQVNTILFDFDGTLIDHFNCIYRCYTYALKQLNVPTKDYETVKSSVGGGLEATIQMLVGKDLMHEALRLFREHFQVIMLEDVNLLNGADWILQSLHKKGYTLAICTNKPGHFTRKICDYLELTPYLHYIVGTQDIPYIKPQKEFILETLKVVNKAPENCLFVGDSHFDIDTAAHVAIPCHIVTTGSHNHKQIANYKNPAAGIYKDMYELGQAVFNFQTPLKT